MIFPQRFLNWLKPKGRSRGASLPPSVPWESRVAIHQTTCRRQGLVEGMAHAHAAGFAGVGLSTEKLSDLPPAQLASQIRASGLAVSSVGIAGGFTRFNNFTSADAVREGVELIELAALVKAPVVRVVAGPISSHIQSQARRCVVEGLRELIPVARACKVKLALQPMAPLFADWSFLHTLDDAVRILDQLPEPEIGLAFGTYHLGREAGLLKRLEQLAPRIASVQLADWVPTRTDTDRRLPGEGELPLPEIVATLEASGYRGWYELEVWSRDLWKLNAATLMTRCQQSVGSLHPVATPVARR